MITMTKVMTIETRVVTMSRKVMTGIRVKVVTGE